jgi:hypothetical protein
VTDRVLIDRPLTDPERGLLAYLSAEAVAEETGITLTGAAAVLGELSGRGQVYVHGDGLDVYVTAAGHVVVHATREWLAFAALADVEDAAEVTGDG